MINRRNFIQQSGLLVAGSWLAPQFLQAHQYQPSLASAKKLVVIQLSGGNDGLNTVVPYRNDAYYRVRSKIAIPKNKVLSGTDELGFHPALSGLKELYDEGWLTVLNGVGYPNPNRSHFRSMDIWQSGSDADQIWSTGWIGRYLDAACPEGDRPQLAVEVEDSLSLALKGKTMKGLALEDPQKLYNTLRSKQIPSDQEVQRVGKENENLAYLYKTLVEARSSAQYVAEKVKTQRVTQEYPKGELSKSLKSIARMILSGVDTQVYYTSHAGFDTHIRQNPQQERLLSQYSDAVHAFVNHLHSEGQLDNVLVLTFSEFGRRVAQNASQGTDHGTANNLFLIGNQLKNPGFFNELPSLTDLQDGDLKFTLDFRRVYATLLDRWLGIPHQQILQQSYEGLPLLG